MKAISSFVLVALHVNVRDLVADCRPVDCTMACAYGSAKRDVLAQPDDEAEREASAASFA